GQGAARPDIRFDESKREIDAGRDAGRCPNIAIADEDRIGIELHRWKLLGKLGASSPVRDRAAAIEEARSRQQEGTAAYRGGAAGHAGARADPAGQTGVLAGRLEPATPGHHQRVERSAGLGKRLRNNAEPARGGYQRLLGHHGQLVRTRLPGGAGELVGAGEDLQGASHVEKLNVLECQNLDPADAWRKTRGLWHLRQSMLL